MKSYFFILMFLILNIILSGNLFCQNQSKIIKLSKSAENITKINSDLKVTDNLEVQLSLSDIRFIPTSTTKGDFVVLESEGLMNIFDVGNPNIPLFSKLIEVPLEATVHFEIESYEEEIIDLKARGVNEKIIPAQPSVSKSEKSKEFFYNEEVYNKNEYWNTNIADYEEVGILRSVRLGRVVINPIQYNPVQNKLRILNNLKIKVKFVGSNQKKIQELKSKYAAPHFNNLLSKYVPNLNEGLMTRSSNLQITYVIVSDRMFEVPLTPFINHKQNLGFNVIVGYTDEVGTTKESIKSYLTDLYNNPPGGYSPPQYVLLVGDVDQIPSFKPGSYVADLYYFDYTYDTIPDVFYGRFSANNITELQPQIDKTIEYELNNTHVFNHLYEALLVSGSGGGSVTNGQFNYATNEYFKAENRIIAYKYLQEEPEDGNYREKIIMHIDNGMDYVNYSGHCTPEGFSDPAFETNDIHNLNNVNRYGLWVGNCCQSNRFDEYECFGEAALRADNKGAIGYIGASYNTDWNEDFWWSVGTLKSSRDPIYKADHLGMYDRMFHTHGEPETEWSTTQGQLIMAGNLAVQESTSRVKRKYWLAYHLMGDPSVKVRFVPTCNGDNVNITESLTHGFYEYLSRDIINASNTISSNANVHYGANNTINLLPGFNIQKGASLIIDRYGCTH